MLLAQLGPCKACRRAWRRALVQQAPLSSLLTSSATGPAPPVCHSCITQVGAVCFCVP